jgi:hypothetical protein
MTTGYTGYTNGYLLALFLPIFRVPAFKTYNNIST